jgi:hypothetical protein
MVETEAQLQVQVPMDQTAYLQQSHQPAVVAVAVLILV